MTIVSPRPDSDQDREIVLRHLGGDAEAFAQMAKHHVPSLLASARRRLGSASEAEDAVQDALERALKSIRHLADEDRDECNLGGWLHRIVTNVCNDRLHRRYLDNLLPYRLPSPQRVAPTDEQAGDPVARRLIREALEDLPASQRQAFLLHEVIGLSYPDLAAETGVSEDNARARVHRARRALRLRLLDLRAGGVFVIGVPYAVFRHRRIPTSHRQVTTLGGSMRRLAWQGANNVSGIANNTSTVEIGSAISRSGAVAASMAAGLASVAGGLTIASQTSDHHTPPVVAVGSFASALSVPTTVVTSTTLSSSRPAASPAEHSGPPTSLGAATSTSTAPTTTVSPPVKAVSTSTSISVTTTSTTVKPSVTTEPDWVPNPSQWAGTAGQTPTPASTPQAVADCSSLADAPGGGTIPPANPDGTQLAIQWVSNLAPVFHSGQGGMLTFSQDVPLQPASSSQPVEEAHVLADVCTDPSSQVLVSDVTIDGQTSQPVQLQGRAVASTGGDGVWGTLYRGSVSFPDGAPSGIDLPSEFVADLACSVSSDECALVVAFAAVSDASTSSTTSSTSTTTSVPSAPGDSSDSSQDTTTSTNPGS